MINKPELKKKAWKDLETNDTILPSANEWDLNVKIDTAVRRAWSELSWVRSRVDEIERNLAEINDGKRDWVGSTNLNSTDINVRMAELEALLSVKKSVLRKNNTRKTDPELNKLNETNS